jgi:uncharacterized membrane protein
MAAALYAWLRFGHVVAAMVWVGGGVMLAARTVGALRSNDAGAVARLVRGLRLIGPTVLAPATIAVFGLGVWMVLHSPAWGFEQTWVQLALGVFAAAFAVGAVHQSRAARNADRAVTRGDDHEARRQLVRWAWGYALVLVLLIGITWDMVLKPGL